MNWKNGKLEKPQHAQEILLCVAGVYHIGSYDAQNDLYTLRDDPEVNFSTADHLVYWASYSDPE